jgi:hypothetical protein
MVYAFPGDCGDRVTLDFDTRILGDVDGDGAVDMSDVLAAALAFGAQEPARDFDRDNAVGIWNVLQVVNHFGMRFSSTGI